MRTLDDVYGDDHDRFPLEQEVRFRLSRLEWDEESDEDVEFAYLLETPRTDRAPAARR
jgi:hypothetical protein